MIRAHRHDSMSHRILAFLSGLIAVHNVLQSNCVCGIESPIPNLEASLVASAARRTIIAVKCSSFADILDDSVVILSCSRNPEDELILRPDTIVYDESIHVLQESLGLTLVTTGLISDTRYLAQTAKQYLTLLQYLYPSDSYHTFATHKFTKDAIAQTLRRASQARALGVQSLIIGNNPQGGTSLHIYTVDPSGTWKHWGSGLTSIGLHSESLRKHLDQIRLKPCDTNMKYSWERALEVAIKALLQTARSLEDSDIIDMTCLHNSNSSLSSSIDSAKENPLSPYIPGRSIPVVLNHGFHVQAMVVFGNEQSKQRGFRWATVSPSWIRDCFQAQLKDRSSNVQSL